MADGQADDAGRREPDEARHRAAEPSEPDADAPYAAGRAEPDGDAPAAARDVPDGDARAAAAGDGPDESAGPRHRAAGQRGRRRWGAAHWTIAVSSVFALAMLAVLVLLAVFRGRTGCGWRAGQSAAPSASPSASGSAAGPSDGAAETSGCGCGGGSCSDPGEVCGRILDDTCNSLVSGCGGSGGGEPDAAPSDGPVGPVETPGPGGTAGPGSTAAPGGDPGGGDPGGDPGGGDSGGDAGGGDSGGDAGGGDSGGGEGCGGSGSGGSSGCDAGSSDSCSDGGCSGSDSGSSPDCSGYVAGHGVSGSLLAAAPVVLATPGVASRLGVTAVRAYQRWLSPRLAVRCRYTPTCSQYGLIAIERYGLLAGARLTQARIRRCTDRVPPGTRDPVPG